jgi:hypothetical protein
LDDGRGADIARPRYAVSSLRHSRTPPSARAPNCGTAFPPPAKKVSPEHRRRVPPSPACTAKSGASRSGKRTADSGASGRQPLSRLCSRRELARARRHGRISQRMRIVPGDLPEHGPVEGVGIRSVHRFILFVNARARNRFSRTFACTSACLYGSVPPPPIPASRRNPPS